LTDIAEVTSASPIEEGAGEQATQLPNDRRNRKGSGLDSMVLAELKQLASSLGIKGTGAMRKSQLIDAIRTAQGRASVPPVPDGTRQDNGSQVGSQGGERSSADQRRPEDRRDRDISSAGDELQQAPREASGQREEVQMLDHPVQPELMTATPITDTTATDGRAAEVCHAAGPR
jgi:hypothetical protein